ncbi:microtubule-associated protein 10 [Heteronotia binoei]|uniref:microtubule-associated protein 10 n=1 Tax=Heteronotia binoei TaxID=13085 RepID=UPI002930298E|nr:microtubule-associated protein 10 [Heteronotia binoei]
MQRYGRLCSRSLPLISRELRKMEEGDGCGDSLFSLELLVETARVEPRLLPSPLPASGPFRPAVALRLLDFPTLLVRAPRCVPGPLVPFGRGKSCLFRLRPDALRGLLRRSPLHALLLALPPTAGPARLLGSCSVSLASAAEELLLGTGPGGRRGRFPLRDLMGEPVGELGLSYRLSNLGSTLLGHLEESTVSEELHREEELKCPPPSPTPLVTQSERGLSLELIPEVEEDQDLENGSLQSFSSSHTEPQPSDIARELETEANVFCPPPMYYNCPVEDCCPAPKASELVTVAKQESVQKEENTLPSAVPIKEDEPSRSGHNVSPSPQTLINPLQLRQTLSQLPLLNALLVELSLLNNQTLQSGTSFVHPQLAWLYQNVEESPKSSPPCIKSVSPPREDKKTPHRKERGRSPTLMLRRGHAENLKCISPCFQRTWTGFKASVYERMGSPEKNSKENSPPRRKLTYGMTNTLRLRLQQTNPGMLKVHEKREHRRKKQANVFIRGSTSLPNSKMLQCSHEHHPKPSGSAHSEERGISDQNVQFNENIETLIQCSVEQDSSTTGKELNTDFQNSVAGCHVKSHENIKERCPFKKVGSGYKKRRLKVHLPRVSLQDTDGLENIIDTEAEKCAQDKDCEFSVLQNASQTNNVESCHECENSDDLSVNCENGGYSEDFTNADSSSFDAPLSSSEPLLVNPKPVSSDTDSYSKTTEKSQASESISSLFPAPSAVSPVLPHKKTSSLKSNDKNVDQYDYNDSPPTRSLKREPADQEVKQQEDKDLQTFENKPKSSDLNSRGTKGQSVEKSHSLRTSQVSSYIPSNMSDFSELESNTSYKEDQIDFEMPDIANQYKHVSELVVNKLPGYTM